MLDARDIGHFIVYRLEAAQLDELDRCGLVSAQNIESGEQYVDVVNVLDTGGPEWIVALAQEARSSGIDMFLFYR